jgi:transcriptional regulator with XRE-family HTH domain
MALLESQALLHCATKVQLYDIEMTLGKRIKAARERLRPRVTQGHVAAMWEISDKAVSQWERDETIPELAKIADLAILLKVPCIWLLKGTGSPPPPDAVEVAIEDLKPSELAVINATIQAMRKQRDSVA